MLKKENRLPAGVRLISPASQNRPHFIMKVSPNGLIQSRFGFTITKRVEKTAVGRNRTKRIIRAYIEQLLDRIETGYDFLFIIKKSFTKKASLPFSELQEALTKGRYVK